MLNGGNSLHSSRRREKTPRSHYGHRDLILASRAGNIDGVKKCLDAGVDVNATDEICSTSLGHAIVSGHKEIISLLLENDACSHRVDFFNNSAISTYLIHHDQGKLDKNVVHSLLRCRCVHSVTDPKFQMPEQLIASFRGQMYPYATQQADFVAAELEQIEDERRRTLADVVLNPVADKDRIFPRCSPINGIILSYISAHKETPAERQDTLQRQMPKDTDEK